MVSLRTPLLSFALLLSWAANGSMVAAQGTKLEDWQIDPYTKNEKDALAKAGYVALGRIPVWGDNHGSRSIEKTLGGVKLRWVETKHFRIGSSLPTYSLSNDKKVRAKVKEELKELEERMTYLDAKKIRKLDPWLRLHLTAMRVEKHYADFCDWLGVEDANFPKQAGQLVNNKYMGQGPYLGQQEKFTLLLTENASTMGRYTATYLGFRLEVPKRHNFVQTGSLFFGSSIEFSDGALKNDTALHCHIVFSLTHNFIDAYKYYSHEVPLWLKEGLAHWFARRVSPEFNDFSQVEEYAADMRATWNWAPKVRARVKFEVYPASSKMFKWNDYDQMKFNDHMFMWSKIDYLMSLGKEKFAQFMDELKAPYNNKGIPPTQEEIWARQDQVFENVWDLDASKLDREWADWVKSTYPKK